MPSALHGTYPQVTYAQAADAFREATQRFRHDWQVDHRTPGITSRLYDAYDALGLRPEPGEYARFVREVDELVREFETMEIRIPPDFAPGIHNTLRCWPTAVTGWASSPTRSTRKGAGLRYLLQQQGLLQYFSFFVFSDEVRAAKPSTDVFRHAAVGLGLPPDQIAHVGDRESNDVAGPLAIGMRAILFTGIGDRGSDRTRANAVCRNYRDLPNIVRRIG